MITSVGLRRAILTLHVTTSVGWLGATGVVLVLGVVGWASPDIDLARAALLVLEPITSYVVLPLAVASLLIGVVQSLGSPWGLFRHYWVLFKLLINLLALAILVMYLDTVRGLAAVAADPASSIANVREVAISPTLHALLAMLALLAATVLAVYKPRGRTGYGRRKQASGATRVNDSAPVGTEFRHP